MLLGIIFKIKKIRKMIKLETLKDMEYIEKDCEWVYSLDLKVNAIKCAKYFREQYKHFDKVGLPETYRYWRGRFDEVMERNNLTEEDLK